jgi:hypothetical protein
MIDKKKAAKLINQSKGMNTNACADYRQRQQPLPISCKNRAFWRYALTLKIHPSWRS